jgi:hypothetical protein
MSNRATQLADRIDLGAAVLADFARQLTDAQWNTKVLPDGRTVGVLVHHIASMYPIEMGVIDEAVAGRAITNVTWDVVRTINAEHARTHAAVTKSEALDLLARNSRDASRAVRLLTDTDLDRAVPFSLSYHAPMTVQFIIEDHPLRHPWHHLARMRQSLGLANTPVASVAA